MDDNQDDEKMEGPNGFVRPEVGKVNEPDLRRLLRSTAPMDGLVAAEGIAQVDECRIPGRGGTTMLGGVLVLCRCCSCSVKDSVEGVVLPNVLEAAAYL